MMNIKSTATDSRLRTYIDLEGRDPPGIVTTLRDRSLPAPDLYRPIRSTR
jgi:hypothetical protein